MSYVTLKIFSNMNQNNFSSFTTSLTKNCKFFLDTEKLWNIYITTSKCDVKYENLFVRILALPALRFKIWNPTWTAWYQAWYLHNNLNLKFYLKPFYEISELN